MLWARVSPSKRATMKYGAVMISHVTIGTGSSAELCQRFGSSAV